LDQAKEERSQILLTAKAAAESYQKEQKIKADKEFSVKVDSALQEIENRKMEAMITIKNEAGTMALDIAEKILRRELKSDPSQEAFVKGLVDSIKLN
jgi:F-type H+-transporting ATPase subunit b